MPKHTKGTTASVSEKSTKSEILDAYNALLASISGVDETNEVLIEEQKLVDHAAHETVEKITQELSQLRLLANQTVSNLTERLTQEAERLASIKKAIAIVQKELEDTEKVKIKASQLYQMIALQKKTEEELALAMASQKAAWAQEQKTYEEGIKQEREREQEDYDYNKKTQRKRDIDIYEEEKQKRERQKDEERKAHDAMLKELEELRKKVAAFPVELEKEIKLKVTETIGKTQHEAHIQQTMAKQDADAKLKLAEQKIASLEAAQALLLAETKEFKQQLEKATNHIKDIAVSVVEGTKKESNNQTRTAVDTAK